MADKNFVKTPADCPATPTHKGGPGTYNGEPGLEKRTMGPNSVPEKTYEAPRPKPDESSAFVASPAKPAK